VTRIVSHAPSQYYHHTLIPCAVKYVALLAFDKIVRFHPYLVSQQQDVILECIDDPDISIRMRALDLVVDMVNGENLTAIVGRLMRQLRNAPIASTADDPTHDRGRIAGVVPYAESDDSDAEESLRPHEQKSDQPPPLPEDYRISVIRRILEMCSRDTYSNISDFDWYIDVLVQLVRVSPSTRGALAVEEEDEDQKTGDVGRGIGHELQNVAIRVKSVRSEAVDAAQSLVLIDRRDQMFPASGNGGLGVLDYAGWLVGEFAALLTKPEAIMDSIMHTTSQQLPARTLAIYLQALPKVFSSMASNDQISWTAGRKIMMSLLMTRIIHFLEPLSTHPNLEVQERAVEYLELMRLAQEAASGTATGEDHGDFTDPPLLLTQAIPALFSGAELNPVAPGAQRKVPVPDDLDLDTPINPNLQSLLAQAELEGFETDEDDVYAAYTEPITSYTEALTTVSAAERLDAPHKEPTSYQNATEDEYLDPDIIARRKAERKERYKDDPFYIDPEGDKGSGAITPLGSIVREGNVELDIDSIPIMDLSFEKRGPSPAGDDVSRARSPRRPARRVEIMGDETLGGDQASHSSSREDIVSPRLLQAQNKAKKSLLEVDSSGLGSLSLDDEGGNRKITRLDIERREQEEAEMKKALAEVERLRLEMQRASERLEARSETVVRKKKKKVRRATMEGVEGDSTTLVQGVEGEAEGEGEIAPVKKKKKKKLKAEAEGAGGMADRREEGETEVKKKKKKRRVVEMDEGVPAVAE
jgi:AP-3 complex subunit delta-1